MSENTIKNCFENPAFGKPDVVADETVDHELDELLQGLCFDNRVEELLGFDNRVDTCELVMNTLSVDWRQGLRAECFQSVINPNIESSDDGLNFEEDVDDVIAINSKSAVIQEIGNSVLAILDKLHEVLFR